MKYFLKGLIRLPFTLVKGCLFPIISVILFLLFIYDLICELGEKKFGYYEDTSAEKFQSLVTGRKSND